MTKADFWDDSANANKLMRELKYLKGCVEPFVNSFDKLEELKELAEISKEDNEFLDQIQKELNQLQDEVNKLELQSILAGPFDRNGAICCNHTGEMCRASRSCNRHLYAALGKTFHIGGYFVRASVRRQNFHFIRKTKLIE